MNTRRVISPTHHRELRHLQGAHRTHADGNVGDLYAVSVPQRYPRCTRPDGGREHSLDSVVARIAATLARVAHCYRHLPMLTLTTTALVVNRALSLDL
jgi:hypothetical protein